MLRDSRSYETQLIEAVRSVNRALGGTYGTSSAIYKSEFNQYEVQLIDAIKGIGRTLSSKGLSLVGGGVGEVTAEQFQALSQRVTKLEQESFFRLVDGNVTLKTEYQNLWVPGWLAAGGIGTGSGGGGQYTPGAGIDITNNVISLLPASASSLGGVKVDGTTITIDGNGVISSVGGSPFNGGEITNDLWMHTNSASYGSRLIFGDRTNNTDWVYIGENSEDHLTMYAYGGITITTNGNSSVVIEDLSVALGELSNVELTNLSDGQGIVWDDTNQVWKNATIGGGGGSYSAGTGINISNNVISLKTASTSQLGGVKVDGTTVIINNGVISAVGGGGGGSGTVTSVGMSVPDEMSVTPSVVTTSGTFAVTWDSQTKNKVLASPASASGTPSFRALVAADIPDLSGKYVTLDTTQNNISGEKTFITKPVHISSTSGLDVNGSSYIDIGDARLVWDATNHALHITKRTGSSYTGDIGVYADGFVSAGDIGSSTGFVKYVNLANQSAYDNLSSYDNSTIYSIGTSTITKVYLGRVVIYS